VKARALGNEADLLEVGAGPPASSEAGLLLGSEAVPKEPKAEPRRPEADHLGLEAVLTKWLHVSLGAKDGLMRHLDGKGEEDDILPIWPRSLNAEKGEYYSIYCSLFICTYPTTVLNLSVSLVIVSLLRYSNMVKFLRP
jgi:hypothetical protein